MDLIKGEVYHLDYNSHEYIFRHKEVNEGMINVFSYFYVKDDRFSVSRENFHTKSAGTITKATKEQVALLRSYEAGEADFEWKGTNYSIF